MPLPSSDDNFKSGVGGHSINFDLNMTVSNPSITLITCDFARLSSMSSFCIEVKETERAQMHNTVKHEYVVNIKKKMFYKIIIMSSEPKKNN